MTRRALWTTAELNRLMKAAKANGCVLEMQGDKLRILPTEPNAELPSSDEAEDAWDKALGLQ